MRRNRTAPILAIAAAGALAVPALAEVPAELDSRGERDGHAVSAASKRAGSIGTVFPQPRRAAATVAAAGREARRERRLRRGPVHPLVGDPDYGTAENAFGAARSGHMHSGQDIFAPSGTPLVAVTDAVVADAGTDGGQGNYVHLYDAGENLTYIYMHMVAPAKVKTGEEVEAGDQLGGVGCTGSCWGEHLHFEVRQGKGWGGEPQDPLPLLRQWPSPN